jgi:hypothetical protein
VGTRNSDISELSSHRYNSTCFLHTDSSRLPPSGETNKYAIAPITRTWRDSLPIDVLLSTVSVLGAEELMNYPVNGKGKTLLVQAVQALSVVRG